ncbi:MAG: PilZ domain-containing protein [Myxococcota bacterium]
MSGSPAVGGDVSKNRRLATRHSSEVPGQLTIGEETHEVVIVDLSLGGAQLEFEHRLTVGQLVQILFRIPTQDDPIEVQASVRWSSQNLIGLQFQGLKPREVWALNKFFNSLQ